MSYIFVQIMTHLRAGTGLSILCLVYEKFLQTDGPLCKIFKAWKIWIWSVQLTNAFCHTKLHNMHLVSHYNIHSVLTLKPPHNETFTCNGNSHFRHLMCHHFASGQLTSYFSLQARNCVPTLLGWRMSWGWRVSWRTCLTVEQTSTWCLCHIHTLQVKEYHNHNRKVIALKLISQITF
jgi:hypothetical protein